MNQLILMQQQQWTVITQLRSWVLTLLRHQGIDVGEEENDESLVAAVAAATAASSASDVLSHS